jgi:hypothetical protein
MMRHTLVAVLAVSLGGCATILEEGEQSLNVRTSNNSNVEVTIDGRSITTPGSVTVDRDGSDISATTSASGCASSTAIDKEVDGTFFVNILSGGLWGSTTDYATGKMWEYDTDVVVNCSN